MATWAAAGADPSGARDPANARHGSVVFGRGEVLPPLPQSTTATVLPASGVTGADVEALKFTQTLRGYKAGEVDWVLDRLGRELDQLRGELAAVRAANVKPKQKKWLKKDDGAKEVDRSEEEQGEVVRGLTEAWRGERGEEKR